jgi:hypothetical protein
LSEVGWEGMVVSCSDDGDFSTMRGMYALTYDSG